MSRHINNHIREPKPHFGNLKDFTYSVDVKRFSREKGNTTPLHSNIYKKLQQRSNQKIRSSHPSSLASFSKNGSHKNMQTKRKLSSGFQIIKTNHHSVSIDHHLLKEKYNLIKEYFETEQYEKVVPLIRHIVFHFEYSNSQKYLYYWLAVSLSHLHRPQEAIEEIGQCLNLYPGFEEGQLFSANLYYRSKNYKKAIEHIQEAISINPKNQDSYLQLALCYSATKDRHKEKDLLLGLIQKFPKEHLFLMLLIECCIALKDTRDCQTYLSHFQKPTNRKDSLFLYIFGLLQKEKGNINQAYILFEQSLKYNNNSIAVNKALLETIRIEIHRRDFYQAHHSLARIKFLELESNEQIKTYSIFVEGVMTMMKKKSQQAIDILLTIANNKLSKQLKIQGLINKYLAYGYFKIGQYGESVKFYQKLGRDQTDESSLYNKLLAEGIELADRRFEFNNAVDKFNKAKQVYPQKVQPYIYIAMVHILKHNVSKEKDEMKKAEVLISALKQMQLGYKLNPNSSNLLYHRTIIHLYFQDWEQAIEDINRCVQKAQQNLPKYFYLRGVCYSCIKDFKKAINQFSICLSLDQNFMGAYFQKAKCYFLLGSTEKGFSSLKHFIELNPDDLTIYKWIGDLLYEGKSYTDALKSYEELGKQLYFETLLMKTKCLMRVGSLQQVSYNLKQIQKHPEVEKSKIELDLVAFGLLNSLLKGESQKALLSGLTKLNKLLQQNRVGYIFQLVDCMNLLGVASFYLRKYSDAYQSFLLVLQLYQSLCQKEIVAIKSEQSFEEFDLRSEDIYFNIIICQLAKNNQKGALKLISEEYLTIVSDVKQKRKVQKLVSYIDRQVGEWLEWEFKTDKPLNSKLKKVDLESGKLRLKTKPVYNMYHQSANDLYSSQVADKIIKQFHTGYIDTMPEGPWIRRNTFGVVFTEEMMPSENSISLGDTFRNSSSSFLEEQRQDSSQSDEEDKKTISKKDQFLKRLKFDSEVEAKLNRMIQGSKQTEKMK